MPHNYYQDNLFDDANQLYSSKNKSKGRTALKKANYSTEEKR